MGIENRSSLNSSGDRYVYIDDWQFPDTQMVNLEYGDGKLITWKDAVVMGVILKIPQSVALFIGETGTLVIGGGNAYKIYDLKNKLVKDVTSEMSFKAGDTFHFSNLLDGIRKGASLNADINVGCISTTLAHLGNISQRTKTTFRTNPVNGHIIDNRAATKLWNRKYQKGWEMKL